jgi:DNA-binding response OmpR family regulator
MKKKILLIDDDKDWINMIAMRLQHAGYEVDAAFDPVSGTAQAIALQPDLILLDVMMPAGGGRLLLKNIRDNIKTFTIPVIVVSGSLDREMEESIKEIGVSGYFPKPVDTGKLLEEIGKVLGHKE